MCGICGELRFDGAAPDMDDHRRAVDIREWLVGEARGRHARGDQNDGVHSGKSTFTA